MKPGTRLYLSSSATQEDVVVELVDWRADEDEALVKMPGGQVEPVFHFALSEVQSRKEVFTVDRSGPDEHFYWPGCTLYLKSGTPVDLQNWRSRIPGKALMMLEGRTVEVPHSELYPTSSIQLTIPILRVGQEFEVTRMRPKFRILARTSDHLRANDPLFIWAKFALHNKEEFFMPPSPNYGNAEYQWLRQFVKVAKVLWIGGKQYRIHDGSREMGGVNMKIDHSRIVLCHQWRTK